MIDYYYVPSNIDWEDSPALIEKCGAEVQLQREKDEWIVQVDPLWFPKEPEPTLEQRFREAAEKWDRETAHLSSPLQKMMHPSYQAILGMSAESPENKRQIIRLLLRDLKSNGRDWFLALSYLTQQNPINPKDAGKTSKMIASWVSWGENQGLA